MFLDVVSLTILVNYVLFDKIPRIISFKTAIILIHLMDGETYILFINMICE